MPNVGTKVKPAVKPSKSRQNKKPTKAELAKALDLKHLELLKSEIGRKFTTWRKSNQSATLGDLMQLLESAQDDLLSFDGDELLIEIEDELSAAAEWLATWEQKTGFVDGEDPASVDCRLANMEEDIDEVEELIAELGESFMVKRLPKWKPRSKTA